MNYPIENSINNLSLPIDPGAAQRIGSFLNRDLSLNSKKAIQSDLKDFTYWYQKMNHEPFSFERLTEREAIEYKNRCIDDGKKPATINRRLITLKSLCKFMGERSPFKDVKFMGTQPLAPKALNESEKRRLTKEVDRRGSLRDRLIFHMMLEAGFRVSELIGLKCSDITLSERMGVAKVRNGKGNKTRDVPLNKTIRPLLQKYIEGRNSEEPLLKGQRGFLTSPISINKIIETYANHAQVDCAPHKLRHTFAYGFLERNKGDIVALSQLLGHSDINTSKIYVQNSLEDLQRKVEA